MANLLEDNNDGLPSIDESKDYLSELVGDGKKFKTPAELARGKYEADEYVKMLVRQKDDLRSDYLKLKAENDAKANLQDYIDKLIADKTPREPDTLPDHKSTSQGLDLDQMEKWYSAKEKEKTADANYQTVKLKLKEKFGTRYTEVLKDKMEELDLTEDEINQMARRSPKAFYKAIGLDEQPPARDPYISPPTNRRVSDNFKPTSEKRTWSYYQKLKAEKPSEYLLPKTQTQMYHDAQALGSEFEDGDFNRYGETLKG